MTGHMERDVDEELLLRMPAMLVPLKFKLDDSKISQHLLTRQNQL